MGAARGLGSSTLVEASGTPVTHNSLTVRPTHIILGVLGVLNGTTSISSESLFGDSALASFAIGAVVLLTSILNTIGSSHCVGLPC